VAEKPPEAPRFGRLQYPLTVFYDASCPLCANEMRALKSRDRDGRLTLVDCSAPEFDAGALGLPVARAALMERIHARDGDGRWLTGVDVFEAVYRAAGLTNAARLWGSRTLRPLLASLYPWVARNRQRLSELGLSGLLRLVLPILRPDAANHAEAFAFLRPHDRDFALYKVGRPGHRVKRVAVAHDHGVRAG